MENATDALYMAFAVLAFVIALSVSIFAFTEVSIASQSIINYNDRETNYTYIEPEKTSANRIVTREDIITTLYRIYKENYIVKFEGIGNILSIKGADGTNRETSTINFDEISAGNNKEKFLNALLTGNTGEINTAKISFTNLLQNGGLYDIIKKDDRFYEHVGIYYLNDNNTEEDDVNKTEKRILTYEKI